MSYCTVTDVERLMQMEFSIEGRPSKSDVESNIARIAARLDGVAQASGYTVPVTDSQAVELMKTYNEFGAACMTWHAAFVGDLPPRAEYWCTEYREFIKDLRAGAVQLPGEDPESDLDPVFDIVPHVRQDDFFTRQDE